MSTIRKALVAAAMAGIAAMVAAWPDGLTSAEIGIIVGAMASSGYAVWLTRNAPPAPPVQ